jgi:hypothetical protein
MALLLDSTFLLTEVFEKIIRPLLAKRYPFLAAKEPTESIDARIKRLDEAKKNLIASLQAIDELERSAAQNKKEAEEALARLKQLHGEKSKVESELAEVRKIVSSDVSTFQRMAGVPGPAQIKRERLIGFGTGVLASVIASAIWFLGGFLIDLAKKPNSEGCVAPAPQHDPG